MKGSLPGHHKPLTILKPSLAAPALRSRLENEELIQRQRILDTFNEIAPVTPHPSVTSASIEIELMKRGVEDVLSLANVHHADIARYGDSPFGLGCFLARRLAKFGIGFSEVILNGWSPERSYFTHVEKTCRILDRAMSALLDDLETDGDLDETLVVLATPYGKWAHPESREAPMSSYPRAFNAVLAGGGIKGGTLHGETDEMAKRIIRDPVSYNDLNATIGYALGVSLDEKVYSPSRRPFTFANQGKPLKNLF